MLRLFNQPWDRVPITVIDVETTGVIPGWDEVVQIALVRFEDGKAVARATSLIEPGFRSIPEDATAVHGISNAMVKGAPRLHHWFEDHAAPLLKGAQAAAYNAHFDRAFVPARHFDDWTWPWLDPLAFVRSLDRFVKGSGRHKLEAACARRGIEIEKAHDALCDTEAAGRLLFKIIPEAFKKPATLGAVLAWQRHVDVDDWFDYNSYAVKQLPPVEQPAKPAAKKVAKKAKKSKK